MPTDRDREAARRASRRLAASYAWPEARPARRDRILGLAAVGVADLVAIVLGLGAIALVLGWRP